MTKSPSRRKKKADRNDHDFYPTDPRAAEYILRYLTPRPRQHVRILDPGCGTGVFGRAARAVWDHVRLTVHGVDLVHMLPSTEFGVYQDFYKDDFLSWHKRQPPHSYDYIIGNPPFEHAEAFCWAGLHLLKPTGHMLYLLPSEFNGAKGRANGIFQNAPYHHEFKLTSRLDFTGGGGDMRWHSVFWWHPVAPPMRDTFGNVMAAHSWHDWKSTPYAQHVAQLALFPVSA